MNIKTTYWVLKLTPMTLVLMLGLLFTAGVANATEEYSPPPPKQHQHQGQGQVQLQGQKQKLNAKQSTNVDVNTLNKSSVRVNTGDVAVETGDVINKNQNTATVEKGAVDVRVDGTTVDAHTDLNITGDTFEYERDLADITQILNNNTASCRYVLGFTLSITDGAGGLGLPLKDEDCLFMEFAALAYAQGNDDFGDKMYCSAPTIVKTLGTKKGWWIFSRRTGGQHACLTAITGSNVRIIDTLRRQIITTESQVKQLTERLKTQKTTVIPACESHPHVENERGYMQYDGRTYVNVDKAFAKESDVAALCGVDS